MHSKKDALTVALRIEARKGNLLISEHAIFLVTHRKVRWVFERLSKFCDSHKVFCRVRLYSSF